MSLLQDIQTALKPLGIPMETGVFKESAPEQYIVVVPLSDTFDLFSDNQPGVTVQETRISLYTQGSYTAAKAAIVRALLRAELTITAQQYIGYEADTGYHHYNIDAAHYYEEEE